MSKKKLGILVAAICIASVIVMFLVQSFTHWDYAWVFPMIGVLASFIVTFIFGSDEQQG